MSPRIRSLLQATAVAAIIGAGAVYGTVPAVTAEMTVEVGGAPMYPSKNIIENAVNSKDHTTLVAAVQAAGLVETLEGAGPFTVFAPTNDAFAALPAGTVDTLLMPENKDKLVEVLTYHVIAGNWSAEAIMAEIEKMGGKFEAKTVEGDALTFSMKDGKLWVWDESGNSAQVTIADVNQSNGVIHVVDTVLLPKMG
ncbi:MAG: fasciclin domain-containing protein [Bauldia sp.]|nr:fasciclin domain-containing protein [Bauldia sp.]